MLPSSTGVPALAANEVAGVAPRHGILATLAHGIYSGSTAVRPPRVEVSVVGAFAVGSVLASLQSGGDVDIVACIEHIEREGQRSRDGRNGKDDRLEGHHGGANEMVSDRVA